MTLPKKIRWLTALAAIAFLTFLAYSTLQQKRFRYEVCVEFSGRSHCATAEGQTPEEAIRTAQSIGCALLTSGRDENIRCLDRPPASVRAVSRP
jgi:hypothetical protein